MTHRVSYYGLSILLEAQDFLHENHNLGELVQQPGQVHRS